MKTEANKMQDSGNSSLPKSTCTACHGTGLVKMKGKQITCIQCRGTGKSSGGYQTK